MLAAMVRWGSPGWWPFLGLFLFGLPLAFGHFGLGCNKTDPGITDPGVATEDPAGLQALSSEAPSGPSAPSLGSILPLAGGALAAGLALRARRDA